MQKVRFFTAARTSMIAIALVRSVAAAANEPDPEPVELSKPAQETQARKSIVRTFAPTGLLGEFHSKENLAAFQARIGTVTAHQAAANATGVSTGYADSIDSYALPLTVVLPLDGNAGRAYLKFGGAQSWTEAHSGNLTQVDSNVLSGQLSFLYRPEQDILLGLGIVAATTNLDIVHNGGTVGSDTIGLQADYLHQISDHFGIAARAIYDWGGSDATIPLGASGRILSTYQESERLFLEVNLVGNFSARNSRFVPDGIVVRPMASLLYQTTEFKAVIDSLGVPRPGRDESFGIGRIAVRVDKDEARPWKLAPYAMGGIEREFVNTISSIDNDPTSVYLKAGVATNVPGMGHLDLYYARRESLKGTYSAGNVTLLLSMDF